MPRAGAWHGCLPLALFLEGDMEQGIGIFTPGVLAFRVSGSLRVSALIRGTQPRICPEPTLSGPVTLSGMTFPELGTWSAVTFRK